MNPGVVSTQTSGRVDVLVRMKKKKKNSHHGGAVELSPEQLTAVCV